MVVVVLAVVVVVPAGGGGGGGSTHCARLPHRLNAALWLCVRRSEVVTEITWVGVPLIANASDQSLGQVQGQPDE